MTSKRRKFITAGIMLSMFLASMEGTVVATAMPSIVAQLGGLSIYSWVFAIYMLASTTTVPIYGKLSDVFGRKKVYFVSMSLFLIGSILCGFANSMGQLVLFRAVQGLGAGGVLPLALIIVGEIFSLEERTRMQGWLSGVWGVSSVIGPLVGGFLVDQISWHWVFFINLIPGSLAMGLVVLAWKDAARVGQRTVKLDIAGALTLTLGALCLLMGLNELGTAVGYWFLAAAAILWAALVVIEKRAQDPILPLHLFRDRLFVIAILHGLLAGWAMFGSISYVPLFVQAVLGTTATMAGITLTPMSLVWTAASMWGSRILLKISFRSLALAGSVSLAVGCYLLTTIRQDSSQILVMIYTALMGIGMGFTIPVFLIAIQSFVARRNLGVATATIQFSRSIGGTIGVSVLGVVLSSRLAQMLLQAGRDPASVSLNSLINPVSTSSAIIDETLRQALGTAMANMFIVSLVAALLSLIAVFFTPRGMLNAHAENVKPGKIEPGLEQTEIQRLNS